MKRNYIGLANTFHESSVAIVDSEGEVVFAEATERYLQNKRALNAVADQYARIGKLVRKYCDPEAELVVAHSWSERATGLMQAAAEIVPKIEKACMESLGMIPDHVASLLAFRKFIVPSQIAMLALTNNTLRYELSQMEEWKSKVDFVVKQYDHHLTHAATACYTNPYPDGTCAIHDGYGETGAYHGYHYRDGKIISIDEKKDQEFLGASLGLFYMILCDLCGFGFASGEEWKVMGLAAYGKFDQKYYDLFKPMFEVKGIGIEHHSAVVMQNVGKLYTFKRKPQESPLTVADLAYTGQLFYSELFYQYLNNLYEVAPSENLILGGGCLLNSSANGEITEKTKFKNAYVFSAPADDGNAVGAALLAYYDDHPDQKRLPKFQSPYLGSEMSESTIENLLKLSGLDPFMKRYPGEVHKKAAELLARDKIIGWVQGRAEFGPRALGNRSILADPRSPECQETINSRVKFREEFRPFAPSILHEFGPEYFENYHESPYMERTLRFRKEVLEKVPGVVHVNNTGRLQTVKREWNEKYFLLIEEFYKLTGIPVILNTSFNVMGKPIIHSVEDAIAVFFTTGLDALVIGDIIIEKPSK